jgi:hypothetical protein
MIGMSDKQLPVLHVGDKVWIEGEVVGLTNMKGEARVKIRALSGFRDGRTLVPARFLQPDRWNWGRRLRARLGVWWRCKVCRQQGPPCL